MAFNGIVPAGRAVPAPYGLFSVADVTRSTTSDEHWIGGIDIETELCTFDAGYVDICGGEDIDFVVQDGERQFHAYPFGIKAKDTCLSVGLTVDDRRARVQRQLELVTPKGVEKELWNGTYSSAVVTADPEKVSNRYLASDDAVVVTTTSAGIAPALGLALLEQALASCGAGILGTIHIPRSVVPLLEDKLLHEDDQLVTLNGNQVAAGTGYDGRGPGETDPGDPMTPWVYATGPVSVRLGPSELLTPGPREAVNIKTNEATYVALRPAIAWWDGCCHYAVRVDLSKLPASGATAADVVMNGPA